MGNDKKISEIKEIDIKFGHLEIYQRTIVEEEEYQFLAKKQERLIRELADE